MVKLILIFLSYLSTLLIYLVIFFYISFLFIQYFIPDFAHGREPEDESGTPDIGEDLPNVPLMGQSHEEGEINQGATWEERKLGSKRTLEHCKQFIHK